MWLHVLSTPSRPPENVAAASGGTKRERERERATGDPRSAHPQSSLPSPGGKELPRTTIFVGQFCRKQIWPIRRDTSGRGLFIPGKSVLRAQIAKLFFPPLPAPSRHHSLRNVSHPTAQLAVQVLQQGGQGEEVLPAEEHGERQGVLLEEQAHCQHRRAGGGDGKVRRRL